MANVAVIGGHIGSVNPDARDTEAKFELGTRAIGIDGFVYRYVVAGGTIAASQTDISVDSSDSATDGLGAFVGTTAFASGEYGWVRVAAALAPDT